MQIRTSLKVATSILVFSFILLIILLFTVFQNVTTARTRRAQTTNILVDMNNLRGLTLEYLLYPTERGENQLFSQIENVGERIGSLSANTQEEEQLLQELHADYRQIAVLLTQLTEASEGKTTLKSEETQRLQDLLTGQLSIVSQRVVGSIAQLSRASEQSTTDAVNFAYASIAVYSSILFVLIAFIIFYLFYRKIIRPLLLLERGTRVVASGNLDYEVPILNYNEVGQLSRSFNKMIEQLRELDEIKAQFLNTAAHQLRTPLGSIRWNTELLLKPEGLTKEKKSEIVQDIHKNSLRMINTIGDLLRASRIQGGQIVEHQKVIDIEEVVQSVVEDLEHEIARKKVRVSVEKSAETLPKIKLDPGLLEEVLTNIISNAVIYNKDNGEVSIKIKLGSEWLELEVADTGIGIPKDDREKVFSKFYRSEGAVSTEPNGTGLGLFISRSHLERWGGSLDFESVEGKGTTFTIKLPHSVLVRKKEGA